MAQFNKPNIQGLQDYLSNSSSRGENQITWFRIPTGNSIVRILPPWDSRGMIALTVYSHSITYSEPNSEYPKYSWTCVDRTFGKPCNICKGLEQLRATGVDTEQWDPNTRTFYCNALVMADPQYGRTQEGLAPGTHVLMRLPKTVYDWIVAQITNPQIGDITDPTSGIDIMINKSGSGLDTKYSCTLSPNGRTQIDPAILATLELYNLSDIFATGFDDQRIEGLVNSLRSAASQMTASIPQYQQQMNSHFQPPMPNQYNPYQQPAGQFNPAAPAVPSYQVPVAPQTPVQQPVQPQPNAFQGYANQAPTQPVPASPYGVGAPVPPPWETSSTAPVQPVKPQVPPQVQPTQVAPSQPAAPSNLPACYGKYDNASPLCVVCPKEIECSRIK